MVDYCVTIEDKEERTRCAYAIIATMGNLFPHLRDINDFKHKLWDHLAIMSDFKLDIDYPYEVVKPDNIHTKPQPIPYKLSPIKYRHYGKIMEEMLNKCCTFPEGSKEREQFVSLLANNMKKTLYNTTKEIVEDDKILKDIKEYIGDVIGELSIEDLKLRSIKDLQPKKNNNNKNNRQNKK